MTLAELATLLEEVGYPVAYHHFVETPDNPIPDPPFVVYLESPSTNYFADNKVYRKSKNITVELYTDYKETAIESKIESLFDENEIPWESDEVWIESEKMYQKIYNISI